MKKSVLLFILSLIASSLFAQEANEIVEALDMFPGGAIRSHAEIKTSKDIKTRIRFVSIESKEHERVGWYEFQVFSQDGSLSGFFKVEKEDLEVMIMTLKWMREIVVRNEYRGDFVGAESNNGWMIWLPKGGGEDVHISKLVEQPTLNTCIFCTSVLANSFCDNPDMGVDDFLQSLIDSFDERVNSPITR